MYIVIGQRATHAFNVEQSIERGMANTVLNHPFGDLSVHLRGEGVVDVDIIEVGVAAAVHLCVEV